MFRLLANNISYSAELHKSTLIEQELWRTYFGDEIKDGVENGEEADRFHQYLAQFRNADMSVYVSDLEETGGGLRREIFTQQNCSLCIC